MPVEIGAPRKAGLRPQGRYTEFIEALIKADGQWISVPVEQIYGENNTKRQNAVYLRVRQRGLRCNLALRNGRFYARINKEVR